MPDKTHERSVLDHIKAVALPHDDTVRCGYHDPGVRIPNREILSQHTGGKCITCRGCDGAGPFTQVYRTGESGYRRIARILRRYGD